jgi:hypothetical protein
MISVGVWSLLPPPIWNSENEHGWQVVHCASAAAIFIGTLINRVPMRSNVQGYSFNPWLGNTFDVYAISKS